MMSSRAVLLLLGVLLGCERHNATPRADPAKASVAPPSSHTAQTNHPAALTPPPASADARAEDPRCRGRRTIGRFATSRDGRWLATTCAGTVCGLGQGERDDTGVDVWDLQAGRHVRTLDAGLPLAALEWGADALLATAASPTTGVGEARLFDAASGKQFVRHVIYCLTTLAFDPAGRRALVAGCDGRMDLLHRDGRVVSRPMEQAHPGGDYHNDARFTPDGSRVFLVEEYDDTQWLDGTTLRRVGAVSVDRLVAWRHSPDGARVALLEGATNNDDGTLSGPTLVVVDVHSSRRTVLARDLGDPSFSASIAWLGTDRLALATATGEVSVWPVSGKSERRALLPSADGADGASTLAGSPDGARLATLQRDGRLALWDVTSGEARELRPGSRGPDEEQPSERPSGMLAWSPDGRHLAAVIDATVWLWDAAGATLLERSLAHWADTPRSLEWLAGGAVLAVSDGELMLLRMSDRTSVRLGVFERDPPGPERHGIVMGDDAYSGGPQSIVACLHQAGDKQRAHQPDLLADFLP